MNKPKLIRPWTESANRRAFYISIGFSVSHLRFLPFELKNFGAAPINELRHKNNKSTSIRSV